MDTNFDLKEHPHSRLNILTGDWILVSPHRTKNPRQGKNLATHPPAPPHDDPACYLCPTNKRADGSENPDYKGSFVFTNDYSSLLLNTPDGGLNEDELLVANSQKGICRVISFSPRHDLTLPQMSVKEISKVVDVWQSEFEDLATYPWIKHIQIFENKGDIMGCSNPHPHGQIWAQNSVPGEVAKETQQQKLYFEQKGKSLLANYLELELKKQDRIVFENEHFVVLVPFWAVWPYETMIVSKRHITSILYFTEEEKHALADAIKRLTTRYDNMFETSFPYSAGMHQSPVNSGDHPYWHWHMHFYPPLLRSATVKKFMVGYEMLANPQRDITAEFAADKLRGLSEVHYKEKG
jgi:UDPglucose--hexose-1-phosphate uridylyltransferase